MDEAIREYRRQQHQRYLDAKRKEKDDNYTSVQEDDDLTTSFLESALNETKNDVPIKSDTAKKTSVFSDREQVAGVKIVSFIRNCNLYNRYFVNITESERLSIPGIFFIRFLIDGNLYGFDLREFFFVAKDLLDKNDFSFFTNQQLTHVIKQWSKVDPSSRSGFRFKQNIEYSRALAKDMYNMHFE